jgi:hypothetical protein
LKEVHDRHSHEIGELHERQDSQVFPPRLDGLQILERHPENLFREPLLRHLLREPDFGDATA